MLPDILGDHRPGKVGMLAGMIAILAPGKETPLDVGRAQILLETQAQARRGPRPGWLGRNP